MASIYHMMHLYSAGPHLLSRLLSHREPITENVCIIQVYPNRLINFALNNEKKYHAFHECNWSSVIGRDVIFQLLLLEIYHVVFNSCRNTTEGIQCHFIITPVNKCRSAKQTINEHLRLIIIESIVYVFDVVN